MPDRPSIPARAELVDFTDRPYRHRLAMHTVGLADWLDVDDARAWDIEQRRSRIAAEPDRVVVRLPDAERAERLLLEALTHALLESPHGMPSAGSFVGSIAVPKGESNGEPSREPKGEPSAVPMPVPSGESRAVSSNQGEDPLVTVGTLTQEDWCLLRRESTGWRFIAGVVCFPTAWEATDKVGLPVWAIHDPVPGYAEQIGAAVDRSLDRLAGGSVTWRRNWSLVTTPDLWLPLDAPIGPVREVGEDVWLRVERQTFRRLADDVIVFGIRVHRWTLAEAAAVGELAGLATAIRTMSPEFRAYKELLDTHGHAIAEWIEARRDASPPRPFEHPTPPR